MKLGEFKHGVQALGGLAVVLILSLGAFSYHQYKAYGKLDMAHRQVLAQIETLRQEKEAIELNLRDEQYSREQIEEDLRSFGKTLGTLEKLSKTDEELLQKYSKVYFLNENYIPSRLSSIDPDFVYPAGNELEIHADVRSHLMDLLEDAKDDGIDLLVASSYRSFYEQASLKGSYTVQYGTGANRFSADQGYSEHQLGTTVDFTTSKIGGAFSTFEASAAYAWLTANAYKYGFVLSYPKGNAYYIFEPWHWRYVGEDLAERLHEDGKSFYDLDQREIDKYLVKLFD
jgi:LAS superfamily LD-carboxypeptidase LdcB